MKTMLVILSLIFVYVFLCDMFHFHNLSSRRNISNIVYLQFFFNKVKCLYLVSEIMLSTPLRKNYFSILLHDNTICTFMPRVMSLVYKHYYIWLFYFWHETWLLSNVLSPLLFSWMFAAFTFYLYFMYFIVLLKFTSTLYFYNKFVPLTTPTFLHLFLWSLHDGCLSHHKLRMFHLIV